MVMNDIGVTFLDTDLEVDTIDFASEHLGCDFFGKQLGDFRAVIIAYADDPDFNIRLRNIYNKEYRKKGYVYFQGISEMEALSIG